MKKIIIIILTILVFSVFYMFLTFENCQCELYKTYCNGSIGTKEIKHYWYCPQSCIIPYCIEEITSVEEVEIVGELEEEEFYYSVSLLEWKGTSEEFNEIIFNDNQVIIHQIFEKPTPCDNINYTIIKENSVINIVPKIIAEEPIIDPETGKKIATGCVQIIGVDAVEINLTLSKGIYTINFYEFWNQDKPILSKTIQIDEVGKEIFPEKYCEKDEDCITSCGFKVGRGDCYNRKFVKGNITSFLLVAFDGTCCGCENCQPCVTCECIENVCTAKRTGGECC